LKPVDNAGALLEELLGVYWSGLGAPLPFFPETSLCFAERLFKGGKETDALRSAERKWLGSPYLRGEGEDPYYRLVYRNTEPLDSEFRHIARRIFEPLLAHREEVKFR